MKNKQSSKPLLDALIQYSNSNVVPFDVPGHKMGKGIHPAFKEFVGENIFKMDVNSMKELDNLSHPEGVILESEQLAADLFGVDNAFFIVNGSTAGVQNMILSSCLPGDKILLPRNIHKSAINGLVLSGANPVYLNPVLDMDLGISVGIDIEETKRVMNEHHDAKALLLLNPTYFGYTHELKELIDYAHELDMIVIVDESHGTHFYMDDRFGSPSMKLGADMATISVHKTGGSLTQSSILLHSEKRVSKHKVRSVINLMQTSSASYLLMASLDSARHYLANQPNMFETIYQLSEYATTELNKIKHINVVSSSVQVQDQVYQHDISKLLINTKELGITGFEVYDLMKQQYNIQLEVGETYAVLAIVSVGDTKESIQALIDAFTSLSKEKRDTTYQDLHHYTFHAPKAEKTPREAFFTETEYVLLEDSINRISGDQIMVYPPGIPLVVPGEIITKEVVKHYEELIEYGNQVIGSIENEGIYVKVLKEESQNEE